MEINFKRIVITNSSILKIKALRFQAKSPENDFLQHILLFLTSLYRFIKITSLKHFFNPYFSKFKYKVCFFELYFG